MVSIIVPVYNVEKYLERCVKSLMLQTYNNIEIILVDDGSTDNCPQICNELQNRDSRIRTIHRANGGLAAARNTGIEHSFGDYITFVDSDDFVTRFYVANLVSAIKMNDSDLAVSMFENVVDGEDYKADFGTDKLLGYRSTDNEGCLFDMLYQRGIETSAPGKLYSRNKIGKLRFPEGELYEDIMFTTKMIDCSNSISIIDNVDYLYYQRNNSIQYQNFSKRKMDCIWHSMDMVEFIKTKHISLEKAAYVRYFGGLCNILFQIPEDEFDEERSFIWKEIVKYRKVVLMDRNARAKSRAAAVLSLFGPNIMKYAYQQTQIRGRVGSRGK